MRKVSMISLLKSLLTQDRKAKLKLINEKELQSYIIARLKKNRIYYKKIESVGVMTLQGKLRPNANKGMSDIIAYINTKVVNIEVKPLRGSLSYEQIEFLQQTEMHCSNVLSVVVSSFEGFDKLYHDLSNSFVIELTNAYKIDYNSHYINIYV
jgi:hypothetical protein